MVTKPLLLYVHYLGLLFTYVEQYGSLLLWGLIIGGYYVLIVLLIIERFIFGRGYYQNFTVLGLIQEGYFLPFDSKLNVPLQVALTFTNPARHATLTVTPVTTVTETNE